MNNRLRQQIKMMRIMSLKGTRPVGVLRIYDPNLAPPCYYSRVWLFKSREEYEAAKTECGDDLSLL